MKLGRPVGLLVHLSFRVLGGYCGTDAVLGSGTQHKTRGPIVGAASGGSYPPHLDQSTN